MPASAEPHRPHPRDARPCALVIVTHEQRPDDRLWSAVSGEIDLLVVADNSTTERMQTLVREWVSTAPVPHVLLQSGTNRGLARAINESVAVARERGCETVVILDHDAVVGPGFFRSECQTLSELEAGALPTVGAVVPIVTDLDPSVPVPSLAHPWTPVRSIITSGTLTRISTFCSVGGLNDALFVDGVDFDFAARVRGSGRRLVRSNRVTVHQQFGEPLQIRSPFVRVLERVVTAFYFAGILAGRSNSYHTRLCRYNLQRRQELVRSMHDPASAMGARRGARRAMQWIGLFAALAVDSFATGDHRYLRLALSSDASALRRKV